MTSLTQLLASTAALSDQKSRLEQYRKAVDQAFASTDPVDSCRDLIDHMLSDDVPLVISRQLLQTLAQEIGKLPPAQHGPVATLALEKIQPHIVSFEDTVTIIRENYAELLEKEECWSKAAQVLAGIDLDSGMRNIDPAYKLQKNIKIAMLYLEDDDPVNAELYIKKASSLINNSKDAAAELQYKVCYARILDSKRRFLEAALRYYELSSAGGHVGQRVDAEDLQQALTQAITCTILASAGPQRSRMLSTLYKDERAEQLAVYPFLEKVFLERILRRSEVEAFSQTLRPHQMAQLPDGSTVLERAVMQHNLLSASKLYNNISITELGNLLGVSPEKAESTAADMISDGRLHAIIDQVHGIISFDEKAEALQQWDLQVQSICAKVNEIIDSMAGDAAQALTARPVPEDLGSDIENRDEALEPDLTEAERNRKTSGEARAARDRDNTYHGRNERAVLPSLGLGFLVRGLFTIRVADPLGLHDQPVYTDIPVSQAAIPDLSCRNLYLQLCRGPPGNGANTQPNAAVAAVLAAHPDLRARLAAIPRHLSDANMVDHVGKQLETAFSNLLTLLFAGRLKKSVSLAGAKVLVGTEEHRRRFGFWG
ncbi:hypothetical protein QJQ45_019743, partial [Haematococcus lacustris]